MSTHKSFLLVAFAPFLWGLQPHLYFLFRWSWSGHDLCVFVCVLRSLPMSRVALGSDAIFCERFQSAYARGSRPLAKNGLCKDGVACVAYLCPVFARRPLSNKTRKLQLRFALLTHCALPRTTRFRLALQTHSPFGATHAEAPKCSFVCFRRQTKHAFLASHDRQTRCMLHRGF